MTKQEQAIENFQNGCNCCQSVVLAYASELKVDCVTALRIGSMFGGGFGKSGEVCGAFSGLTIVVGALFGYDDVKDQNLKKRCYAKERELLEKFREKNGELLCRNLLSDKNLKKFNNYANKESGGKKPVCVNCVKSAVEIIEKEREK